MPRPRPHRSILVIQHDDDAPPAVLGAAAAQAGLSIDVRNLAIGDDVPDCIFGNDGLVLLGGDASVVGARTDETVTAELRLIERAAASGLPTLGICLGAQLCSVALGGDVMRGESGLEIGWTEVHATTSGAVDPLGAAAVDGACLFEWHEDVCVEPPGSCRILTAERYPVQGYRCGSVWALQSHPEVDETTIRSWCRSRKAREQLEEVGITTAELIAGVVPHRDASRRILDAWCEVVSTRGVVGSGAPPPRAAPDLPAARPRGAMNSAAGGGSQ